MRVRELFPLSVLASLITVPAALAASVEEKPEESRSLISSKVFSAPLDAREAESQLDAALEGAKRNAARGAPQAASQPTAVPAHLQSIASCESGGDPSAIGGGGAYRGKYQFSYQTWAAVGGSGDPAAAPEAEQDRRAAMLYSRSGPSQWPVCGS